LIHTKYSNAQISGVKGLVIKVTMPLYISIMGGKSPELIMVTNTEDDGRFAWQRSSRVTHPMGTGPPAFLIMGVVETTGSYEQRNRTNKVCQDYDHTWSKSSITCQCCKNVSASGVNVHAQ